MVLNERAQRALLAVYFAILAIVYVIAWLGPAVGMVHDDGAYLVIAKTLAAGHGYRLDSLPAPSVQTQYPPLFALLLAPFTLISSNPQWLKLVPLACTLAWLVLTRKLLLKMGASGPSAGLVVALTAASPTVVFLSTTLLPASLFALLITACLLLLLADRPVAAGLVAALATLTSTAGVALIAAGILALIARRHFRGAVLFAALSMTIIAPWFGWSLAHSTRDTTNFIAGLAANEKLAVIGRNIVSLFTAPFFLLTGFQNNAAVAVMALVAAWSLVIRRQFLPDVFVLLYCASLLLWAWPPDLALAPIIPFMLWIVWRVFRLMPRREALVAFVLMGALLPLWTDISRIPSVRRTGFFAADGTAANDWGEMKKLFDYVRSSTPPAAVVMANLDPAFNVYTGHKTIRGFVPRGYSVFYAPKPSIGTPDQLATAIRESQVSYVTLTPERNLPESPLFHKAVEALERGGVLEPVAIPGIDPQYRLLHVVGAGNAALLSGPRRAGGS